MNRRGFIGALSGAVAWAKSGFRVSPAASAVQPTCLKPQDYLLELDGQAVFPICGKNGILVPGKASYYVERGAIGLVECVYVDGSLFDALRALPSLPTKSMADLIRGFRLTDNRMM